MHLTVKARITIAMVALTAVTAAGTATSSWLFSSANRSADIAAHATQTARDTDAVAIRLTQFLAESRTLALAVSASKVSEDSSVAYGRLSGAEADVTNSLRALERDSASEVTDLQAGWDALRTDTYLWINREAVQGESGFRLSRDSAGRFRASTGTNLTEPSEIAPLSTTDLSRKVRDNAEILRNRTLRAVTSQAEEEAAHAGAASVRARELATRATLVFTTLSLLLAVAAAIWLYRSIAIPLGVARAFADRVASGDLDATLGHTRDDEIGTLARAVEQMKDAVVRRIATMQEMAGAVLVTAENVRREASLAQEPAVVREADVLLALANQMLRD